jgi:hypothetical protein
MGKSVHDATQAELGRQAQAWSQPQSSSWSAGEAPTTAWSGSSTYVAGSGGGNPGVVLNVLLGIFALATANWLFPMLYPLAGAAAAATAVFGVVLAQRQASTSPLILVGLASLVVFWLVSRVEHRLAQRAGYRRARHLVRLLLVALAAYGVMVGGSSFRVPSLADSVGPLIVVLVVVVAMHVLLTKATGLRERWHGAMEAVRLRPKHLES